VKLPREQQQDAYFRQMEIDPTKYTPDNVKRALVTVMPPIKINAEEMMKAKMKKTNE
jgi:transposase